MPSLQQTFQDKLNRFRIGKSRKIDSTLDEVSKLLGEGYTLERGDQIGDYTRITVSGNSFTDENALTLDIRLGGASAVADTPAIMLRSHGGLAGGAESIIGAKVVPDDEAPGGWDIRRPTQAFADIINATFESTKRSRKKLKGRSERRPNEELYGLLMDDSKTYQGIRKQYQIPRGVQQIYSIPSPGEQARQSSAVNIYMPENASYEDELERIRKSAYEGHLGDTLFFSGVYDAERTGKDIFQMQKLADIREVKKLGGRVEHEGFTWRGYQEGSPSVYAMLKYIKMHTTYSRSRSPMPFPLEQRSRGKKKSPILVPTEPKTIDDLGIDPEHFGDWLQDPDRPRYVKAGIIFPEEDQGGEAIERDVHASLALLTTLPTHKGAGIISPEEVSGVDAWGVMLQRNLNLPFKRSKDFEEGVGQLSFIDDLVGQRLYGGERHPLNIGTATNIDRSEEALDPQTREKLTKSGFKEYDTQLELQSQEYEQQVIGASIVIAPYMDERTGEFYATKNSAPKGSRLIKTDELAKVLRKRYSKKGIHIEQSGTDTPYLSVNTLAVISHGDKGIAAVKEGGTPLAGPGSLQARWLNDEGKLESIRLGSATQESKAVIETFVSAFGLQPYKNKMEILGMIDPNLKTWAEKNYKPGQGIPLAAVAQEYQRLLGSDSKIHYMEAFKVAYDAFRTATPEQNKANLSRYGIGYLPGTATVNAGRVTKEFVDVQKKIARELGVKVPRAKNGVIRVGEGDKAQTFFPVEGLEGFYEHYFNAAPHESMIMPVGKGAATEWPGRGGKLNMEAMLAIANRFPQFAEQSGLLPEQGPTAGSPSKERLAWLGIMRAYMFNESAMAGEARFPSSRGKSSEERQLSQEFLKINKDAAIQLLESKIFTADHGGLTEEQAMELLGRSKKEGGLGIGDRTMMFETSSRFLPSPQSIVGIEKFDDAIERGESQSHFATQYLNAIEELLRAEATGDIRTGSFATHTDLMGGPESRIGRILGGGKDVTRHLYGREVAGAVGGHYRVMNILKPGEAYMPDREMNRALRSAGLRAKEIKQFREWMDEEGGVSGIFWRFPHVSEEYGSTPLKFITSKELARRGVDLKAYRSDVPGTVYMNPFSIEPFIGDEDLDPHGVMLGMGFKRSWETVEDEDGKPRRRQRIDFYDLLASDPDYNKMIKSDFTRGPFSSGTQSKVNYEKELRQMVGNKEFSKYSTMRAAAEEYYSGKSPIDTATDAGWVSAADLGTSSDINAKISSRRGTTFNVIRSLKAASAALGIPPEVFKKSIHGLPFLYQQSLEWNKEASLMTPLEVMANTAMFKAKDVKDPAGTKESHMELSYGTEKAEKTDDTNWGTKWSALDAQSWGPVLKNMLLKTSEMDEVSNEALAMMFANTGRDSFMENYNAILSRIGDATGVERANRILRKTDKQANMISSGQIAMESMAGMIQLTHATTRSFRKAKEKKHSILRRMLEEDPVIPWRGQTHTAAELMDLPEFVANRRIYNMMTRIGSMPGESTFLSGAELEDVTKEVARYDQEESDVEKVLGGIRNWLGYNVSSPIKNRMLGGMTKEQLKETLTKGPQSMHVSDIATIASGDKFSLFKGVGLVSKMLGNVFGVDALKKGILAGPSERNWSIGMGNMFEVFFGQTEQKTDKGGTGYLMIPRNRGEERMHWTEEEADDVELLGLPDFLKVSRDKEGKAWLDELELKFSEGRAESAKLQSSLYGRGFKKMFQQDPQELRRVLSNWDSVIRRYYSEKITYPNEPQTMQDDWVDTAMEAIEGGRIRTHIAHGGSNRELRNAFKVVQREEVNIPEKELTTAIKKTKEYTTSRILPITNMISSVLRYGEIPMSRWGDDSLRTDVELPRRLVDTIQNTVKSLGLEHLQGKKMLVTGGEVSGRRKKNPDEIDPFKPLKPGEEVAAHMPLPQAEAEAAALHGPETVGASTSPGGKVVVEGGANAQVLTSPPTELIENIAAFGKVMKELVPILQKLNNGGTGGGGDDGRPPRIGLPNKYDPEIDQPVLAGMMAYRRLTTPIEQGGQTIQEPIMDRILKRFQQIQETEELPAGRQRGAPLETAQDVRKFIMNRLGNPEVLRAVGEMQPEFAEVKLLGSEIAKGFHAGRGSAAESDELERDPRLKEEYKQAFAEYQEDELGMSIANYASMSTVAKLAARGTKAPRKSQLTPEQLDTYRAIGKEFTTALQGEQGVAGAFEKQTGKSIEEFLKGDYKPEERLATAREFFTGRPELVDQVRTAANLKRALGEEASPEISQAASMYNVFIKDAKIRAGKAVGGGVESVTQGNLSLLPEAEQSRYMANLLEGIKGLEDSTKELTGVQRDHLKISQEHARQIKLNTDKMEAFRDLADIHAQKVELADKLGGPVSAWRKGESGRVERPTGTGGWEEVPVTPETTKGIRKWEELSAKEANLQQAITLAEGLERQAKPSRLDNIGTGLRSMFGSFGFFYLQRVLGWAAGGLTQGYGERETYEQAEQIQAAQAFGFGTAGVRTSPETAINRAQFRAGGAGMYGLRALQQGITGTPLGDMLQTAKGTGGMTLAGLFASAELGIPLATAGPVIGAGALATSMLIPAAMQASYAYNREPTLQRAAGAELDRQRLGAPLTKFEEFLGGKAGAIANWYTMGPALWDVISGPTTFKEYMAGQTPADIEREQLTQQANLFLAGEGTRKPFKPQELRSIAATIAESKEWAELSEGAIAQAVISMGAAGQQNPEDVRRYGRMVDMGINPAQIIAGGMAAGGYVPTKENFGAMFRATSEEAMVTQAQQVGAGFIQGLSPAYLKQQGIGAYGGQSPDEFLKQAGEKYAKYAYSEKAPNIAMESQLAQRAKQLGESYYGRSPEEIEAMDEQQIGTLAAIQSAQERKLTFKEQVSRQYGAGTAYQMMQYRQSMQTQYGQAGVNAMEAAQPLYNQFMQFAGNNFQRQQGAMNLYQQAVGPMAQGDFSAYNVLSGAAQGNPIAMYMAMQNNPALQAKWQGQIPVDINRQGTVTSFPIFTSSMTAQQAQGVWGSGWASNQFTRQAVTGYTPMMASSNYQLGGIQALQAQMSDISYQSQMASAGAAMRGIQLQQEYLPKFWAIEDKQRNLGYRQSMWGFQQQQAGLEMQSRQFYENMGLNIKGAQMQRTWAQQDWAYNDQIRNMQFGWRQEDFQREVRFMTGRERKGAERQMERETIMFNMEGDQIERQKERQKETWKLEDQRFDLAKKQHEEQKKFQEEAIEQQKKFYLEGFKLQEQMVKLQREFQLKQLELSKQAAAAQAGYARQLHEAKTKMEELQRAQDTTIDKFRLSVQYTDMVSAFLADLGTLADKLGKLGYEAGDPGAILDGLKDKDKPQPPPQQPDQGVDNSPSPTPTPGEPGWGDGGDNGALQVTNPWNNTAMSLNNTQAATSPQNITLNVSIGNERLERYVLKTVQESLSVV